MKTVPPELNLEHLTHTVLRAEPKAGSSLFFPSFIFAEFYETTMLELRGYDYRFTLTCCWRRPGSAGLGRH